MSIFLNMFGVLLASIGTFFDEVASSIGKQKVSHHEETVYTMGFLNLLWGALFFILIGLFKRSFVFTLASLPTFAIRAVLEIIATRLAIKAICQADRSTFSFIRVLTIPLLLIVDLFLHYKFNLYQLVGIGLIIFTLFFILASEDIKKQGAGWTLLTAVVTVATISLYKYDITHYNSVVGEQTIMYLILMTYFFITALYFGHEDPFRFLKKKIFLTQSLSNGLAGLANSFAYNFAPAAVISAAVRSTSIFWSVASGQVYFKEKHLIIKIFCLLLLATSIILLVL